MKVIICSLRLSLVGFLQVQTDAPESNESMAEVWASVVKSGETIDLRFSLLAHFEEKLQDTEQHFFYFHPDKKKKHRARPHTSKIMTAATSLACFNNRLYASESVSPQLRFLRPTHS